MKKFLAAILCITVLICLCGCNSKTIPQSIGLVKDFSPDEAYDTCYFALNEQQQKIYEVLYSCAIKMPENFVEIVETYENAESDLDVAYTALIYDNPEFFWMPTSYICAVAPGAFSDKIAIAFKYSDENLNYDYLVSIEERSEMQKELDNKINEILENAPKDDKLECQLYLDELICENVEYIEDTKLGNTVYGALVLGKALCEGYSKSYKLLCNRLEIGCELIVGSGKGNPHMWNTVCNDGEYSYTDVTWNDLGDFSGRAYFNVDEKTLLKDHRIESLFSELNIKTLKGKELYNFNLRECNTLEKSYFSKRGLELFGDFAPQAAGVIAANAELGIMHESFYMDDEVEKTFRIDREAFIGRIQAELSGINITEYANVNKVLILYYEIGQTNTETINSQEEI